MADLKDVRRREDLPPLERAVSDALDEYGVRLMGRISGWVYPVEFLEFLAEEGYVVATLPRWEAVYEPGNVSSHFIGYLNDEKSAKAAAEAWLRSQTSDHGELRWDEFRLDPDRFGYDVEYLLREVADDGTDTESGIRVQHRIDRHGKAS